MIEFSIESLFFLFLLTTFAKSYGAIFGGGSLLSQPALLALGLPPQMAIATDVFTGLFTDIATTKNFLRHKKI